MVKEKEVAVKAINLTDATGSITVSLWREKVDINFRVGDYIQVTNVVTNMYEGQVNLQSTYLTKLEVRNLS